VAPLARLARLTLLAATVLAPLAQASGPVFRCVIDGTVTYQSVPCPSDRPVHRPTPDELNAERKKRLAEGAAAAASAPAGARPVAVPYSAPPARPATAAAGVAPPAPATAPATAPAAAPVMRPEGPLPARDAPYRCDGRLYCSQMRSCSEARFFLAHCPGVKMDGNRDGVPCQQQWCTGPLAR
jgi:hypothetical protein